MPTKKAVTECSKQSQKRGKRGKIKEIINKAEEDTEKSTGTMEEKVSVNRVLDLGVDGATEYLCPIEKEGDTVLEVECGPNKALMYLSKLYQGSKGSCISYQGSWLTPNEFQYVSGRETAKDWKRSIRHQGKSIKLLFSKGILHLGGGGTPKNAKRSKKSCVKRQPSARRGKRSANVSLDSAGEENTDGRETRAPSIQEQLCGESDGNTNKPKEQGHGEGDLSDANSDSTENYDVDFMEETCTDEEKASDFSPVCDQNQTSVTDKKTEPTQSELSCSNTNVHINGCIGENSSNDESYDKDEKPEESAKNIESKPNSPERNSTEKIKKETDDVVDDEFEDEESNDKNSRVCDLENTEHTQEKENNGDQSSSLDEDVEEYSREISVHSIEVKDKEIDEKTELCTVEGSTTQKDKEELQGSDEHERGEEEQRPTKRPSPVRESKLGSIIDQLRVNREKVTKEKQETAAEVVKNGGEINHDKTVTKPFWPIPPISSSTPLETEIKIAKIIEEQRKDCKRVSAPEDKTDKKYSPSSIDMKKYPERSTSVPSDVNFLHKKRGGARPNDNHTLSSPSMLYPWMKKESVEIGDKMDKPKSVSPSPRLNPIDKLKRSPNSTQEKKDSPSDKDYNDYMRLLAAKQEGNPFFLSPPLHDPYFSMWTPDLLLPPGLFNPYSMMFGPNGHRPEIPTTTSMSSLCSLPPTSLPFLTPPRPPHSMPYPMLDSFVPHTSPKESPALPHSCQTSSRKRGPAEADTACALDLSTKRAKLECSKKGYYSSPLSRSSENVENHKKSALLNLSKAKLPEGERTHSHKSSSHNNNNNVHRHKKSHSAWPEKDLKTQRLQCKCGADNPENIMNWSAEKVFDFVAKLEGCSSYAKTFLDHRIEGKLLPLLTTDALIRNLGLKVGPAIILSEAVTRHVQDMSRFFHPCSYCKLKSSQRVSI